MPVIINDLEVIVEAEAPPAERAPDGPLVRTVRAEDISDIVERQTRAMARVLAH